MSCEKYNGWKNYETWVLVLWFDNDGTSEYFSNIAEENKTDNIDDDICSLAKEIESHVQDDAYDFLENRNGFFVDLINSGIRKIDYREIARHYIDDLEYTEEVEAA